MQNKFYFLPIFLILIISLGCHSKQDKHEKLVSKNNEFSNETYRPKWWNSKTTDENRFIVYSFSDSNTKEKSYKNAQLKGVSKFINLQKRYIVNLTEIIRLESNIENNYSSSYIKTVDSRIFKKKHNDSYLEINKEIQQLENKNYRCFLALSLDIDVLNKSYIHFWQLEEKIATDFLQSKTYRNLLDDQKVSYKYIKNNAKNIKQQKESKNKVKDIPPAWFKISYDSNYLMINKSAVADSKDEAIKKATKECIDYTLKHASNFAKKETQTYRKWCNVNDDEFLDIKIHVSRSVKKSNITAEFNKKSVNKIGNNRFKAYVQYKIDRLILSNCILEAIQDFPNAYNEIMSRKSLETMRSKARKIK